MIPLKHEGDVTIPITIFSGMLVDFLGEYLVYIITGTLTISAVLSLVTTLFKPRFITNNKFLNSLFNTTPLWLTARILGGIFGVLAVFQVGPEIIISEISGAFVLNDLLTILFSIFLFAGLLLAIIT